MPNVLAEAPVASGGGWVGSLDHLRVLMCNLCTSHLPSESGKSLTEEEDEEATWLGDLTIYMPTFPEAPYPSL